MSAASPNENERNITATVSPAAAYDPRRLPYAFSFRRVLCREFWTYATGLGVLYRVIEKMGIEAGGEFL